MNSYSQLMNWRTQLCKPVDKPLNTWFIPQLELSQNNYAYQMTVINLLDALFWELDDFHTNASYLRDDSLHNAEEYATYLY